MKALFFFAACFVVSPVVWAQGKRPWHTHPPWPRPKKTEHPRTSTGVHVPQDLSLFNWKVAVFRAANGREGRLVPLYSKDSWGTLIPLYRTIRSETPVEPLFVHSYRATIYYGIKVQGSEDIVWISGDALDRELKPQTSAGEG